ncbi:MAG: OmpA family protein [Armatimonadetes bacterium]|nr:OmpA family protein [Armatimonadota bacterium]
MKHLIIFTACLLLCVATLSAQPLSTDREISRITINGPMVEDLLESDPDTYYVGPILTLLQGDGAGVAMNNSNVMISGSPLQVLLHGLPDGMFSGLSAGEAVLHGVAAGIGLVGIPSLRLGGAFRLEAWPYTLVAADTGADGDAAIASLLRARGVWELSPALEIMAGSELGLLHVRPHGEAATERGNLSGGIGGLSAGVRWFPVRALFPKKGATELRERALGLELRVQFIDGLNRNLQNDPFQPDGILSVHLGIRTQYRRWISAEQSTPEIADQVPIAPPAPKQVEAQPPPVTSPLPTAAISEQPVVEQPVVEGVQISGKAVTQQQQPLNITIAWEDLQTRERLGSTRTNPADGSYRFTLPYGRIYGYYFDDPAYYPAARSIDARNPATTPAVVDNGVTPVVTIQELVENNVSVRINNVFFDFDKSEIKSESFGELDRLAKLLKKFPELKVEIAGHTDESGTAEYNYALSGRRSQSVVAYLITQGIPARSMQARGYGKDKPIAPNTEDGKALNRRVEFKFTSAEQR